MNPRWEAHDRRMARHTTVVRFTQWALLLSLLTLAAWLFMPEVQG